MIRLFLNFLRRHLRRFVYPVGVTSFYGFRCRVYSLFYGHVYFARCVSSFRIFIEIV